MPGQKQECQSKVFDGGCLVSRRGGCMKRIALPPSIALILVYWIWTALLPFLRPGEAMLPTSMIHLVLLVVVKFGAVLGVVWSLMYANGERPGDLGFRLRDFRLAWLRGTLYAVGLFVLINLVVGSLPS